MKKILTLSLLGLALVSCQAEYEAVKRRELREVQAKMPSDCQLYDLGDYGRIDQLVMIRCPDSQTTTTGYDRAGKTQHISAVQVNG
ncbi:hypothetical protein [Rhizobium sp. Leaf383]|uniref:hypothetical protein n=1 Tax=Rhizobium sp. Leaf383 TaxID=1736357 RepID=UPI0007125249|nr:hypothetical protein [Rhizobium sp. Leaf383]KQS84279.1 hypothetical protein ASG58_21145 [Rhizobium sp. Leaf383]